MCKFDWSVAAAWVQAIGSIAAILVAIWLGERSARQSRELVERERRRQADIVASTISTKLHLLGVELNKKSHFASVIANQVNAGVMPQLDDTALRKLFLLDQLPTFADLRSHFTLFDRDTGILANTTWDVIEGYNPMIESAITVHQATGSSGQGLVNLCTTVVERMQYIEGLCSETESRLEQVHELDRDDPAGAP
jgi:hypothetical protein